MSAELNQARARSRATAAAATAAAERIAKASAEPGAGGADGNGAPVSNAPPSAVPQAVAAPGITATAPLVTGNVIADPILTPASTRPHATTSLRRCSACIWAGLTCAILGFVLVFVVPSFKSALAGRTLLLLSVILMAVGAGLVVLGVVRDTARRI